MATMFKVVYAAVRKTVGGEWIDDDTLAYFRPDAEKKARDDDARLSEWAKEHPVLRIARFELVEIE